MLKSLQLKHKTMSNLIINRCNKNTHHKTTRDVQACIRIVCIQYY